MTILTLRSRAVPLLRRTARTKQQRRLHQDAPMWVRLCNRLGVTMVQVSANFLPASSLIEDMEAHRDAVVDDLGALAGLGAAQTPPVRFAFEALSFSAKIDTWRAAWNVVKGADLPNLDRHRHFESRGSSLGGPGMGK